RSPHGAEHIKEMLTGQILWVSKGTVALDAVVYALIGLFHFACARQFMAISEGVAAALGKGIRVRLWDFFFYASFGIVVSLSVRVAGVLLVFCFLIVPAVISALFAHRFSMRLVLGWTLGTFVTILGLLFSWAFDFPSGPAVACFFGLALVVSAALRGADALVLRWAGGQAPRAFRPVGVTAVLLASFLLVFIPALTHNPLEIAPEDHGAHVHFTRSHARGSAEDRHALRAKLRHGSSDEKVLAAKAIETRHIGEAALDLAQQLLVEPNEEVITALAHAMIALGDPCVLAPLKRDVKKDSPLPLRLAAAQVLVGLKDKAGAPMLIEILALEGPEALKHRQEALQSLRAFAGSDFRYDPSADPQANKAALEKWAEWWRSQSDQRI
ncbi:MAG: hypothetical protein FJ279_01810, partial [Planctomycetes bacterium]|nr:hypothetical protein [Planctomycetota bacterium]